MLASDVCNQMYALARTHPGQDVWQNYDGIRTLVVQRPESAMTVLANKHTQYEKNLNWMRQSLGRSRVSEIGEGWASRRDLSHPYFTHFDRDRTCLRARAHAHQHLLLLCTHSDNGHTVLDDDLFRHLTMSILCDVFLSLDFQTSAIDPSLIARMMDFGSYFAFVSSGGASSLSPEQNREMVRTRTHLLDQFRFFRNAAPEEGSMLAAMLAADADPHSDFVLEQELLAFLAAGAESSACTLGWACYLLAREPELQERLRSSVLMLDEDFDWESLGSCHELKAFLAETLRLYPPSPLVTRQALAPDVLGETVIEAGQLIVVSLIGVCHAPGTRPDPWELDLDAASHGPCAGSRMPFSVGPRICGGKQFAMVELMTILATYLRHVRFELTDRASPRFYWKTQMLREGGQPVVVHRLDPAQRLARAKASAIAPAG